MGDSQQDVLDSFDSGNSVLGMGQQSSSIIVNNLDANTLPMCVGDDPLDFESDDVTVIFFAIDESPSMTPVEQDVIDGFNEIVLPALKGASDSVTNTMEIGALSFTENINPWWGGGFKSLEEVPPLTGQDYDTDRGHRTALYEAVLKSYSILSVRAEEIAQKMGIFPRVILVVLSDGKDRCAPPPTVQEVKAVADDMIEDVFVRSFMGFETGEVVDFKAIAKSLGFNAFFEMKRDLNETDADRQKAIRDMLQIASESVVQQSQSVVSADNTSDFFQSGGV